MENQLEINIGKDRNMDNLLNVKIKALEDLYNKFKEIYEDDSRLHAGQWRCGSPRGMEEMYDFKRALEIVKATSKEDIENIKNMDDMEIYFNFIRNKN